VNIWLETVELTFCCCFLVHALPHCCCEQVLQLPPGAVLLASSPTARNELWSWGPNILASQFHVEFDEPLVLQKIWATLKDVGRLDDQQAEGSRRVLEAGGQMNANMLQVSELSYALRVIFAVRAVVVVGWLSAGC
jgi:GMP synthase-like glutamine amidotransferase